MQLAHRDRKHRAALVASKKAASHGRRSCSRLSPAVAAEQIRAHASPAASVRHGVGAPRLSPGAGRGLWLADDAGDPGSACSSNPSAMSRCRSCRRTAARRCQRAQAIDAGRAATARSTRRSSSIASISSARGTKSPRSLAAQSSEAGLAIGAARKPAEMTAQNPQSRRPAVVRRRPQHIRYVALFTAARPVRDAAATVARGLVDADLEGLPSHGVMLADMYVERLRAGLRLTLESRDDRLGPQRRRRARRRPRTGPSDRQIRRWPWRSTRRANSASALCRCGTDFISAPPDAYAQQAAQAGLRRHCDVQHTAADAGTWWR